MAGRRPPRDNETAPGNAPGAASFPRSAAGEMPQGIVRLSDLFSPQDFEAGAAQAPPPRTPPGFAKAGSGDQRRQLDPDSRGGVEGRRGDARSTRTASRRPDRQPLAEPTTPVPAGTTTDAHGDGPAYESLFGGQGDTRRPPKRERKPATALQRALGLLTRREHSRKELTRKLVSRGVDPAEVEAAVQKLAGAGWQDERRFAESVVRSRASAGYGPLHIRAELGTHDLPAELRRAALDDFEGDWVEIARELVQRRFGRIDDPRQRDRKASDFLIRRGFPGDVVRAAVRSGADD